MKHEHNYTIYLGGPLPSGASIQEGRVNFSIYSRHASDCTLVLFRQGESQPFTEISIPASYRIGDVFTVAVAGLDYENVEYGFRLDGTDLSAEGE